MADISIHFPNSSNIFEPKIIPNGKFSGKAFGCSNKWKPIFFALMIIGLCSLATGAGIVSVNSVVFISLLSIGTPLFTIGVIATAFLFYRKKSQDFKSNSSSEIIKKESKIHDKDNSEIQDNILPSQDKFPPLIDPPVIKNESPTLIDKDVIKDELPPLVDPSITRELPSWEQIIFMDPSFWIVIKNLITPVSQIEEFKEIDFELKTDKMNRFINEFSLFINKLNADEEIVQIKFNKEKVEGIYYNGKKLDSPLSLPKEFLDLLIHLYIQFLKISSDYNLHKSLFTIRLYPPGLKIIPAYHLEKLIEHISNVEIEFNLYFLEADRGRAKGVDTGGLTRDFFNDLMQAACEKLPFAFQRIKNLYLYFPAIKRDFNDFLRELEKKTFDISLKLKDMEGKILFPNLNPAEEKIYYQIGKVFMLCHQSPKDDEGFLTGHHFDPAIFKAIHALTPNEIDLPFDQLSWKSLLKMCKAISEGSEHKFAATICNILLNENPSLNDLTNAAHSLLNLDEISDEEFNFLIAPNNETFLKNKLLTYVLTAESSMGILCLRLAPIHAIAKGMKSLTLRNNQTWKMTILSDKPEDLSDKIQGGMNRKLITESFTYPRYFYKLPEDSRNRINQQLEWLKGWILNEATDEELKKILKFITGSSSMPYKVKIKVLAQDQDFFPGIKGHTCSYEIELSPKICSYGKYSNKNYEAFIETIKDITLNNVNGYSMR